MKAGMTLVFILFFSILSWAGERLHLKSGSFDPSFQVMSFEASNSKIFVVQFHKTASKKDFDRLQRMGVERFSYLPDDAFVVYVPNQETLNELNWENIRAVIPYEAAFKVSPQIMHVNVFNGRQRLNYSVRLLSEKFASELWQFADQQGVKIISGQDKNFIINMTHQKLYDLAHLAGIEFIELAPEFQLHVLSQDDLGVSIVPMSGDYSDITGFESGTRVMGFEQAWRRGFMGQNQVVAMADTGLDTGELPTLAADFRSVIGGYALGLFSESWKDPMGHGTHVAGSVVGDGEISNGLIHGGAPSSRFVAMGMWSDMLNNISPPSNLKKLLEPAYNDGARIHTNSWGNPRAKGSYDNMSVQADEFMWQHPDLLIIFAAGNSGVDENRDGRIDEGSVTSPATAKNVLSVGASENLLENGGIQRRVGDLAQGQWSAEPLGSDKLSDNPNGVAVFSSRGPTNDGRVKPDIVAPGTNILSNCSQVKGASPLWGNYNSDYCFSGGTSMAAPLVAGGAVVTRQYLSEKKGLTNPSAASVKAVMLHTAFDMYPGQFGSVGKSGGQELLTTAPNVHQGFGRADLDKVTEGNYQVVDYQQGLQQGQVQEFTFDSLQKSKMHFTLAYTDAPGSAAASRALVNNIDVIVEVGGDSFNLEDSTNNFESGHFELVNVQNVKVKVVAKKISRGPQPFAFAVTFQ